MNPNTISVEQVAAENQRYMVKVYTWMCVAMIITGAVAFYTASSDLVSSLINSSIYIFYGLVILQFVAVGVLLRLITKMSAVVATIVFILYSVLFGLTLSYIFKIYTSESIASTFFITSGTFGVMSVWGFVTKTDLTRWGNILLMGLVGVIIATLVNQFFLQSSVLYWITTCGGVLLFVGLTAYDTQKIKNANIIGNEGSDEDHKESIKGALILYLDFINLFLFLLRIFGRRK